MTSIEKVTGEGSHRDSGNSGSRRQRGEPDEAGYHPRGLGDEDAVAPLVSGHQGGGGQVLGGHVFRERVLGQAAQEGSGQLARRFPSHRWLVCEIDGDNREAAASAGGESDSSRGGGPLKPVS